MGLLHQLISGVFRSGQFSQAKVDQDSILEGLTDEPIKSRFLFKSRSGRHLFRVPYHKGVRFIMIIAIFIVAITFILHYSFVYIKDVLLYPIDISVNPNGALTYRKSLGREYGIYLFNTSDLWADTGISVSKNDHVRISVSGAFHSSVGDLIIDAEKNTSKPAILWVGQKMRESIESNKPQEKKRSFCLAPDGYIGDVLFTIAPEFGGRAPLNIDPNHIKIWKPNKPDTHEKDIKSDKFVYGDFRVTRNGHLLLAVNDIYFRDTIDLKNYYQIDSLRFGRPFSLDTIISGGKDFSRIFYNDNIGQILVCVEIQRHLKGVANGFICYKLNPRFAYRELETKLDHTNADVYAPFAKVWLFLLYTVRIAAIIGFWCLLIIGGIYLLFLIVCGLSSLISWSCRMVSSLKKSRKDG